MGLAGELNAIPLFSLDLISTNGIGWNYGISFLVSHNRIFTMSKSIDESKFNVISSVESKASEPLTTEEKWRREVLKTISGQQTGVDTSLVPECHYSTNKKKNSSHAFRFSNALLLSLYSIRLLNGLSKSGFKLSSFDTFNAEVDALLKLSSKENKKIEEMCDLKHKSKHKKLTEELKRLSSSEPPMGVTHRPKNINLPKLKKTARDILRKVYSSTIKLLTDRTLD